MIERFLKNLIAAAASIVVTGLFFWGLITAVRWLWEHPLW
jgi:hypothetical protein